MWGTKFKFNGLSYLPSNIGSITYKTSLFHLQPRQMKIKIKDLASYSRLIKDKPKQNFTSTQKILSRNRFFSFNKPKKPIFNSSKKNLKLLSDDEEEKQNASIFNDNNTINNNNEENDESKDNTNSNSEVEEKQRNKNGSSLIIYPLNDSKKILPLSFSSQKQQQIKQSNNNLSTLSASNDLSQLPYISRPTSPANLIRPISPPAIQIKEPISSPRVITRHQMSKSVNKSLPNNALNLQSSLSLNSPNSLVLNDSCDNEVINYLNIKPSSSTATNSCYTTITETNHLNEFEKFKSLISCLDPTTNDVSNRVLLLNKSDNPLEAADNLSNNRLSFSDPLLVKPIEKSISSTPTESISSSSTQSLKTNIINQQNKNEKLKPNTKVYTKEFRKRSTCSKTSHKEMVIIILILKKKNLFIYFFFFSCVIIEVRVRVKRQMKKKLAT